MTTPPNIGRFGPYRLIRRLSMGGMAEVFEAEGPCHAPGGSRRVAIKRLLPTAEEDAELVRMFRVEAELAKQLSHPRVAALLETGVAGGVDFIAYEFIDGHDLVTARRQLVARDRWLSADEAAALGVQVAEGLAYAHAATDRAGEPLCIVHRDVSPQNVMVERSGGVKLIDFGIAKFRDSEQTQGGLLKGKHAYMSPEQVRREPLDGRSDLFSLGTILYELLAARRLFRGNTYMETLEKVEQAVAPPLAELRPDLPGTLVDAVHRCLARERDDRFDDAGALAAALNSVLEGRDREEVVRELFKVLCPPDEHTPGMTIEEYRQSLRCAEDEGVETTDMKDDPEATGVFIR